MNSIGTLMVQRRADTSLVAWDRNTDYVWSDFCSDVERVASYLSAHDGARVALFTDNAYRCAVGMLASFVVGRRLLLLPNALPASLALLTANDLLITDVDTGISNPILLLSDIKKMQAPASSFLRAFKPHEQQIDILTSGSTGEPQIVHKTLANFDDEVAVLESLWHDDLEGRWILGTVSHQHVYGVLFRVVWPLCAGRPFAAFLVDYPEQVSQLPFSAAIVSSPAFLKRIGQIPAPTNVNLIFSSGGPLDEQLNMALCAQWGVSLWEVFGSTETGGVAVRNREKQPFWQLMPGVKADICEDDLLWVDSPFVAQGHQQMADRAVLLDGRQLQLLGRADRIVKLEEKRLSLNAVERAALNLPEVKKAHSLILPGQRELLALVVVPTFAGRRLCLEQGVAAFKKKLRDHLSAGFESASLPRKIRIVETMAETSQGKLDRQALLQLFSAPDDAAKYPQVMSCETMNDKLRLQLRVPEQCVWFQGHFDEAPILSGVAQLDWVMTLAQTYLNVEFSFQGVDVLKFQQVIQPGNNLALELEYQPDKERLNFSISSTGQCSSGRILLGGVQVP